MDKRGETGQPQYFVPAFSFSLWDTKVEYGFAILLDCYKTIHNSFATISLLVTSMVVNKKQATFTVSPNVWTEYGVLVQHHFGGNQVSAQLELLIRGEAARLKGDLDGYLHSLIRTLRDVSGSIPTPESRDAFVGHIDDLEVWVANARGIQFAATDIACNYEQLQRRYVLKVRHSDELKKLLKGKGKDCYEDLLDFAIEQGLDMDSNFDNLKDVGLKMLANSKGRNPENLQIFFNLLEIGREKRLIERDLTAIQRQKYEGPDVQVDAATAKAE